jgi:hypothetical protein
MKDTKTFDAIKNIPKSPSSPPIQNILIKQNSQYLNTNNTNRHNHPLTHSTKEPISPFYSSLH